MRYKTRFLFRDKDYLIPVTSEDIAYFYMESNGIFCITRQSKKYVLHDFSLKALEKKLDPHEFFKINRQFIISYKSIVKIQLQHDYKLKIILAPVYEKEIIVSRNQTGNFKKWANQ